MVILLLNFSRSVEFAIGHDRYSNMAPRLSEQTSIFGVVFFVSKKLTKFTILTLKPRSHVSILIYRTWPVELVLHVIEINFNKVFRLERKSYSTSSN